MLAMWRASTRSDKAFMALLCLFFALLGMTGGASRADEPLQVVVVVASAALILVAGAGLSLRDWQRAGAPLWFLLAALVLVLIQLIPLPPSIWTRLPGRHVYAEAMAGAGIPIGWHPLSLTPDATLSAVLAFAAPFALLALVLRLSDPVRSFLYQLVLALIGGGALLAVVQLATGGPYFYRIANFGEATGSFANRNHFALFTALSLPLLAFWAVQGPRDQGAVQLRPVLALVIGLTVAALLLVAGSRGGLLVGMVGGVLSFLLWTGRSGGVLRRGPVIGAAVALVLIAVLTAVFSAQSRDIALSRILASPDDDIRAAINRTIVPMIVDHLPFGSGAGSFAAIYKVYEPLTTLGPRYANQAHNDILQALLEGGVPSMLLLLAFTVWFVRRTQRAWRGLWAHSAASRPSSRADRKLHQARAGSVMIVMIGIMSAFDYPLRTPLVATVFILAVLWLEAGVKARLS
jgi:O-antigen ligase